MILNSNQENDTTERSIKGSGLSSLTSSLSTARSLKRCQVAPSPKETLKTRSPNAIESIPISNLSNSRSLGGGVGTPTNAIIKRGQQPKKMATETAKPSESSEPSPADPNNWVAVAKKLISFLRVKVLNGGTAFDYPVDGNTYRDYYQLIEKPMYFNKIIEKLENGEYEDPKAFYDDVLLIFDNCYKFNVLTYPSDFGRTGVNLENAFLKAWAKTPMAAEVPPRPLRDRHHILKPQPATSGYRCTSSGGHVSRDLSKPQEKHAIQDCAVHKSRKSGSQQACDTKPDGNRTSIALGIEPERGNTRKRCDEKSDSNAKRSRPNGKDSEQSQSIIRCSSKDMVCPGVQPSSLATQRTASRWSDEKRAYDLQEIQKETNVSCTQITGSHELNFSIEGSSFIGCKQCKEKLQKEHAYYEECLKGVIRENQSLREKNADLEEQNQALNDMENKAISFYSEKENLLEQLDQIRKEHEREKNDLQKLLTVTTEEKNRVINDYKTKEDEIRNLELCNVNAKKEKQDLEATKNTLQLRLNEALTQADILASKKIQEKELLSEIENLKTELEKKEKDNCSLNNEIEKLQYELEEKESHFEKKEKQNEELANENAVLKKNIETIKRDLQKRFEESENRNKTLQARYRESTLETERLEKQKEEVSIQRNVFQEKQLELEAKLEKIEKENENKKKELQGRADQIRDILQYMIN